jgi:hypothetical protein
VYFLCCERFSCSACHNNERSGDDTYATVDIFDVNKKKWATAHLSVARYGLAATSLPSQGLALFGGGQGAMCANIHFLPLILNLDPIADDSSYDVVDIFDGKTMRWSTATLSVARYALAATASLSFALFCGGQGERWAQSHT